jgi:formylglycine-generating enzyme required for sulfatase activity
MNREPTLFPPHWAEAWGDDLYGLWAEFVIGEQRQRMRWIEPGQFWMGSPGPSDPELPPEPECNEDEGPRHRVTISAGFWLADTACTQALWTVVMGSNPSRFSDDAQCPVENVSFENVQAFLTALRPAGVDADAALPTEAQWEYACRAGTDTPFHFGAQITPAWVNYDGNLPYNQGAKGEYRQRTVPVKALPANRWGLYQMHGNVFEWCRDGLRDYTDAEVLDPEGPMGAARALRGGSWLSSAGYCRSALRFAFEPGNRSDGLGFRLVLRS